LAQVFPSLLDTSGDLVAISDSSGWITYANAPASQLLGEPCKQSIGTAFGPSHEFAPSERGPHRLALFDARGSRAAAFERSGQSHS